MARDPERKKKRRDEDDAEEARPVNIEAELKELESAWSEAEDRGDQFGDIPDGTYQVKITKATINKSQSSKRLQISWEFTIISGDLKNRKKFAHDGLETKENMDYVKTRLARLGVDVEGTKLGDMPEILESVIGKTCEIKVKTRGDFQNAYVQKLIELEEGDEDETDEVDEDAPKKKRKVSEDDEEWAPSERSKSKKDADEDEDEDDEPKKKSKSEDDDESEDDEDEPAPKKKSKREEPEDDDEESDEDDEPAPKKKSRDADDEDEDEAPKKKSKKSEDDDEDDDEAPVKKKKSKF